MPLGLDLDQKLARAWSLRYEHRIEECQLLSLEVASALSLPSGLDETSHIVDLLRGVERRSHMVNLLILDISLLRARGRYHESGKKLSLLDSALRALGILAPQRVLFEHGMQDLVRGDFSNAHEFFLMSVVRAEDDISRLVSHMNALLCLENLGLPYTHTYEAVHELLEKLSDGPGISGVREQLRTFTLRQAFREGKLGGLSGDVPSPSAAWSQGDYFRLWVSELPYCSIPMSDNGLANFVQSSPAFCRKGYRTRTLQGLIHPDDLDPATWTDWADRFYLWAWNWLVKPQNFSVQRVMVLLRGFCERETLPAFTAEDAKLITNAFLWLSVFDPNSTSRVEKVLGKLYSQHQIDYPLLDFETLVARYFIALRDQNTLLAEDYLRILQQNRLWDSPGIAFSAIVKGVRDEAFGDVPEGLRYLVQSLRELVASERGAGFDLVVDYAKNEITGKHLEKPLVCEASTRAIEIMKKAGSVPVTEFSSIVFGIHSFDPSIHNQKLFRLLRRLNALLSPNISLRTKAGWVLTDGDWSSVFIKRRNTLQFELSQQTEWRGLAARNDRAETRVGPKSGYRLNPEAGLDKPHLSRREVEALTGKSRATANRLIQKWEKCGWVRREGSARTTRYKLSAQLKSRLRQEQGFHMTRNPGLERVPGRD